MFKGQRLTLDTTRRPDMPGEHELVGLLRRQGIDASFVSSESDVRADASLGGSSSEQLALVDITYLTSSEVKRCVTACSEAGIPVIALVPRARIADLDSSLPLTDLIFSPPDPDELVVRARFALRQEQENNSVDKGEFIRVGDLVINTSSYEVTLGGERIGLRFKEYELLRLLAQNPGRVFTRDALLNQVWGYEYFGGTRTVDVHIRRLRSKIEDSDHSYVETIWNTVIVDIKAFIDIPIPIIVDADTGYGNPLNVARTVRALIDAGAAGCFLEDQEWPKKCGHMHDKKVISEEEYIDKIRAAVDTKGHADFFVVARTDAIAAVDLEEAIARAHAAKAAGADATFIEAPRSRDELVEIGRQAPKPTVANMVEEGRTPILSREELVSLGFQLLLYPLAGLYASAKALESTYQLLLSNGTTAGHEDSLITFERFNKIIGVDDKNAMVKSSKEKA